MIFKFKLNSNIKFITSIIAILSLFIALYILYIKFNNYEYNHQLETFSSNIMSNNPTAKKKAYNKIANKIRNKKNNRNNHNNYTNSVNSDNSNNSVNSVNSKNKKINRDKQESFDDIVANFEEKSREMYKDADYMYNFQDILKNYWNSFDTKEFNRKSNNTGEVLDKFSLYKERFFDIFE